MEYAIVNVGDEVTRIELPTEGKIEVVKGLCRTAVVDFKTTSQVEANCWLEDIELVTRCRMSYSCNAFSLRWEHVQEA